ncbi:chemotaxis protein CheW [Leptolyngbya sp. AN03gr2]|uniref:chemotaxis protein CheW n=1 Tax=unclassified Leptolyngbya TaxID=2650499 RepID=UPI003D313D7F
MLLLLFHLDEDTYAIDSTHVVEVLPIVMLRKVYQVPAHVSGVFRYRNCIVPVVDLCKLIRGEASRSRFSTRIIMVRYQTRDGENAYVGLLAERVTETLNLPHLKPIEQSNDGSYLGEVLMHDSEMIQRFHWESLITDVQNAALISGGAC